MSSQLSEEYIYAEEDGKRALRFWVLHLAVDGVFGWGSGSGSGIRGLASANYWIISPAAGKFDLRAGCHHITCSICIPDPSIFLSISYLYLYLYLCPMHIFPSACGVQLICFYFIASTERRWRRRRHWKLDKLEESKWQKKYIKIMWDGKSAIP